MPLLQACEERLAGGMRLVEVFLEIEGQSSPHTLSILLVLGQLGLCSVFVQILVFVVSFSLCIVVMLTYKSRFLHNNYTLGI